MADTPTKKAIKLRKTPIKKMFECEALANTEVSNLKKWIKDKYGVDYKKLDEIKLANAIYQYILPKAGKMIKLGNEELWINKKEDIFTTGDGRTLKEILEKKTGNCVSFTTLYCMLAEELKDNYGRKIVKANPFFSRMVVSDSPPADLPHLSVAVKTKENKLIMFDLAQKISNANYPGEIIPKEELLVTTLNNLGCHAGNLGKFDEAITYFNKALEINPNSTRVLFNKAITFEDFKKYDDALNIYNEMINKNEKNVHALHGKGLVLAKIGKWQDAIILFQNALKIDEKHPLMYYLKQDLEDVNQWKEKYLEYCARKKMIEEAKEERHQH